jgi:hypothetical protein
MYTGNPSRLQATYGCLGGLVKASRHDAVEGTAAARSAFLSGFERHVDPTGILPPAERARRAEAARKAHFYRLAILSAKTRRARVQRGRNGGAK